MSVCEASEPPEKSPYLFQSVEPARLALIDRFYRSHGYKIKCAAQERVFALTNSTGAFVAAARLVPQASSHYWLRNMLVDPQCRGQGLATRLIMEYKPLLYPKGCYCFALPHLVDFYRQRGFEVNPAHCPAEILTNYQKYRTRGRDWVLMGYQQD